MAEQTVHLQKSGYRRNDRVEMFKPIEPLNCSLFLLARFLCACHSSSFLLVEIRGGAGSIWRGMLWDLVTAYPKRKKKSCVLIELLMQNTIKTLEFRAD